MSLTANGWSNKSGTSNRSCSCGTWKKHWLNFSGKAWPDNCSVLGCINKPTLGAHIINPKVAGERIVPICSNCNNEIGTFSLRVNVNLPFANISKTCGK